MLRKAQLLILCIALQLMKKGREEIVGRFLVWNLDTLKEPKIINLVDIKLLCFHCSET